MGEKWKQWQIFLFLGSKITVDGDCSHEFRRHLFLGRKDMTNLDSVLKIKDITLPTKVCIVKSMVFPVVMYRCESWTIKKAECWITDAFELVLEKILESPLDSKEIKPVNPKGNQCWIFIGRTDTEAEVPILWPHDGKGQLIGKDSDAGKDWGKRRRGWQRTRWLDGITDLMDMNLEEFWEMVRDREDWHAVVHGVRAGHNLRLNNNNGYPGFQQLLVFLTVS